MISRVAAGIVLATALHAQNSVRVIADCVIGFTFTASGSTPVIAGNPNTGDNRQAGCVSWTLQYQSTGFSGVTLTIQDAPGPLTPGSWVTYAGTIDVGINPNTSTTGASTITHNGAVSIPWIRVTAALTGAGTLNGVLYGLKAGSLAGGSPPSGGTVTSVGTACGLKGGPITTTGTISLSELVNAQTGTAYTILASDCGKLLTFTNSMPIAVTVPAAGGSFPNGFPVSVENYGSGTATLTPAAGTIGGASTLVLPAGSGCALTSDGTNWDIQCGTGGISNACPTTGSAGDLLTANGTAGQCTAQATAQYGNNPFMDGSDVLQFNPGTGNYFDLDVITAGGRSSGLYVDYDSNDFNIYWSTDGNLTLNSDFSLSLPDGAGINSLTHGWKFYPNGQSDFSDVGVTTLNAGGGHGSDQNQLALSLTSRVDSVTKYCNPEWYLGASNPAYSTSTLVNMYSMGAECTYTDAGSLTTQGFFFDDQVTGHAIFTIGYGAPDAFEFGSNITVGFNNNVDLSGNLFQTGSTQIRPGSYGLADSNGNEFLGYTATAAAVDYFNVVNGAAGTPGVVALQTLGSDTNISLKLTPKGSGVVQIDGATFSFGGKSCAIVSTVLTCT